VGSESVSAGTSRSPRSSLGVRARVREFGPLRSSILAGAALLGLVAAIQPLVAVGLAAAVVFAFVVFADLAVGFAILAFLSFLDILPTSGSLSPAKAAGLLLAVAWLARLNTRKRDESDFFGDYPRLTWLMWGFFAWATLTLLWASSTGTGLTALSRYLPNLLLLPIAYTAVRGRRDLEIVLTAIVLGAILAATFGVLQPPSTVAGLEERATGTIGDPNELAAALLVGLALGTGLVLARDASPLLRLTGLLAVPLCVAGIFLSLSRGGLVALAVMLTAGAMFAGRWRAAMAALLVIMATTGVIYFTQVASLPARERITTVNGGSGRSDLWKVGLRMVRAHPVGGVGVGNFQNVSSKYALQPGGLERPELIFSAEPKVAHNTYLQVLSETGVVGFLLFIGLVLSCLGCALRAARIWALRNERTMEALARAVLLGVVGMLVADFFISEMYSKLLWTLLALGPTMLGLALHARAASSAPETRIALATQAASTSL
jgi:O-antigen ligase